MQQIERELKDRNEELKLKESEMEQLNSEKESSQLQDSIQQNQTEISELQLLCRQSQAGDSMNGSYIIDEILLRTRHDMRNCLSEANLDPELSVESLNTSIIGLENDLIRFEKDRMEVYGRLKTEEGRLKEVDRQLNEIEEILDHGMKEIMQEYTEHHFQSQDYYEILSEFQDRKQIVETL